MPAHSLLGCVVLWTAHKRTAQPPPHMVRPTDWLERFGPVNRGLQLADTSS